MHTAWTRIDPRCIRTEYCITVGNSCGYEIVLDTKRNRLDDLLAFMQYHNHIRFFFFFFLFFTTNSLKNSCTTLSCSRGRHPHKCIFQSLRHASHFSLGHRPSCVPSCAPPFPSTCCVTLNMRINWSIPDPSCVFPQAGGKGTPRLEELL